MPYSLAQVTTDHRSLVGAAAHGAGIIDPVAIVLDDFQSAVLDKAVRGPFLPVEGVFIRDWDRALTRYWAGTKFGIRLYTVEGIRLARCVAQYDSNLYEAPF